MREILVWPTSKDTAALNYCDVADAAFGAHTQDPDNQIFCYRNRRDRHGQMVTPYMGPTGGEWDGSPLPEPPQCLAARADAVLSSNPEWPEDDI